MLQETPPSARKTDVIDLVTPESPAQKPQETRSSWSPLSLFDKLRHGRGQTAEPISGAGQQPQRHAAPRREPSTGSDTSDFVLVDDNDPFSPALDSDRLPITSDTADDEALARALQLEMNQSPGQRTPLARSRSGGKRKAGSTNTKDEELARRLQEEEYDSHSHPRYTSPRHHYDAARLMLDDLEQLHGVDLSALGAGGGGGRGFGSFRVGRRRSQPDDNRIPVAGQNLRLDSYEDLLRLDELNGVVKKGLTSQQIRSLPLIPFQKGTKSEEECKCFVCFETFNNGDKVMLLPCLHSYHPDCISGWLKDNRSCPVCRVEVATGR
jgi:hypothetical protein